MKELEKSFIRNLKSLLVSSVNVKNPDVGADFFLNAGERENRMIVAKEYKKEEINGRLRRV